MLRINGEFSESRIARPPRFPGDTNPVRHDLDKVVPCPRCGGPTVHHQWGPRDSRIRYRCLQRDCDKRFLA